MKQRGKFKKIDILIYEIKDLIVINKFGFGNLLTKCPFENFSFREGHYIFSGLV